MTPYQLRQLADRKRAEDARFALERKIQHVQKLESLGVLAGGIAHDFNNILMAILGNTELALSELSPMAPARRSLLEIGRGCRRAAGLAGCRACRCSRQRCRARRARIAATRLWQR